MEKGSVDLLVPSHEPNHNKPRPPPKRFIKNQIPDSILNDPALNTALSLLPSNYNLEVHKCVWRILTSGAKRVALQFPEGLLMYSLVLTDIFTTFGKLDDCFVLGDVTFGACCVDDFSATALGADLLIHYGHSCLVPIDSTKIPSLYVFVEIKIDVDRLINSVRININEEFTKTKKLALAGTIQFASAIRAAKPALESAGFEVLIPQSKPLSAGEILGCTSPTIPKGSADILIFVADGRFHLEAFMIANPGIMAFRYDPYIGNLFLEEYDHEGMKLVRKNAIIKAREASSWGIILGTLGRQGNPRILDRLQSKMREKGFSWTTILMSEISPTRIALFGDSVDAWIQIACPRLSIDWGEGFEKPLLTPFEAEIALGFIPGWWEKLAMNSNCVCSNGCGSKSCCSSNQPKISVTDYPMDYYAQNGGEWNQAYSNKPSQSIRRNIRPVTVNSLCYHIYHGHLITPVQGPLVSLPGLPLLETHELPSVMSVSDPDQGPDSSILHILTNQFSNVEETNWLLFNTFDKLEDEVVKQWPEKAISIGPTVPSIYLKMGPMASKPDSSPYIEWLNTMVTGSVVYVSFGTVAKLGEDQVEELAWGIKRSNMYFLWVVRDDEQHKLPTKFQDDISKQGLVVSWCSQLEVLAHKAMGCFLSHCGWNSTIEALSLGVPMLAMPQRIDQPTNAKFVEDIWRVGVRAKVDDKGVVRREEIENCIKDVMQGGRREEFRMNVVRWKELAKEAVDEGGSSDRNIDNFIAGL